MTHSIAIVGAGGMGRLHAGNLKRIEGISIAGVCDPNPEAAKALAEAHGTRAYECFEALLSDRTPDAVFVCVPPFAHSGEAEMAARRGIHIFIEKPIGLSTGAAEAMVRAVVESGVRTQVGYHFRYGGAVRELVRRIRCGEAGRGVLFTGRYECNSLHAPWWREKAKAGSQILEQVIHTYDMAMHLMGRPLSAAGLTDNLCHRDVHGYTLEDVSCANIRFEGGALGSITATNCAVPGRWVNQFEAVFERLTVRFDDANHAVFVDTSKEQPVETRVDAQVDMYFEEVLEFVRLLDGAEQDGCPIPEGFESLRLVEAVTQSAERGGALISLA